MAKIRINQEELDLIGVEESKPGEELLIWLQRNAAIVGGVLALILTAFIVFSYFDHQKQAALGEASNTYDEMIKKLMEARSSTTWASEERKTALDDVIKKSDELIAQFPGTPVAREALFLKGTAYFQLGDNVAEALAGGGANNQKAIEVLTEYQSAVPANTLEHAKASLALAYALENKFFLDSDSQSATDALQYYAEAEESDKLGFIKADAMMGRARMFTATNKPEEATTIYREIMESRFTPVVLEDVMEAGKVDETKSLVNAMRQRFLAQISIAGQARLELSRLGVDVDKEYPLTKEAEKVESETAKK